MDHECLPEQVPQLCEYCFCPVEPVICGGTVATREWPGTDGARVFVHAECLGRADPRAA